MTSDKKADTKKKTKKVDKPKEAKVEEKPVSKEAPKKKEVEKPKEDKKEKKEAPKEVKKVEEKPADKKQEAPKETKPKKKTRKKKSKKPQKKVSLERGKRKESVARATIIQGKGNIRMNSISISAINNKYIQEVIKEPLKYVGPEANNIDISIRVYGGGIMGQAQAARTAIAKALVSYFNDEKLKEKFMSVDRSLLIEDTRRVEPKKYLGPKARAKYQKSYR